MYRNLNKKKKEEEEKFEDLLVFGYQCTLFRDNEKALYIDQGKHLIPWMEDESTMIDRYDGRGHLHDLTGYDSEFYKDSWQMLSDKEKSMEALIDEERYMDLFADIEEKLLYEEEELKRSREDDLGFGAVGFTYEESSNQGENQEEKPIDSPADDEEIEDPNDPYVVPPFLQLPNDLQHPLTMKLHKVIEKTASFIAQHGTQMEIVMKTKQKSNKQFSFLEADHRLHGYYKLLLHLVREGKYLPQHLASVPQPEVVEKPMTSEEFLDSVQSKLPAGQIENTPYAILLNRLREHTVQFNQNEGNKKEIIPPPPDQQPIIDKMASYVIKNGPEFEVVVRNRNEPRFRFLEPNHIWHTYYQQRKKMLIETNKKQENNSTTSLTAPTTSSLVTTAMGSLASLVDYGDPDEPDESNESSNTLKNISFSIKSKEKKSKSSNKKLTQSSSDEKEDLPRKKDEKEEKKNEENELKRLQAERRKRAELFAKLLQEKAANGNQSLAEMVANGNSNGLSPLAKFTIGVDDEEEEEDKKKISQKKKEEERRSNRRNSSGRHRRDERSRSRERHKKAKAKQRSRLKRYREKSRRRRRERSRSKSNYSRHSSRSSESTSSRYDSEEKERDRERKRKRVRKSRSSSRDRSSSSSVSRHRRTKRHHKNHKRKRAGSGNRFIDLT